MIDQGMIVDGRPGGLILGKLHSDGGVFTVTERNGQYLVLAEFEGDEYLVNWDSYQASKDRFDEINNFTDPHNNLISLSVTPKTRVLNTWAKPDCKFIWVDTRGQFMIRRVATAKYFTEIEQLNEKKNGFGEFDLKWFQPK